MRGANVLMNVTVVLSLALNVVIFVYSYCTWCNYYCMDIFCMLHYSALVFEYQPLDVQTFEGNDETVSFKCNASSNSKYNT